MGIYAKCFPEKKILTSKRDTISAPAILENMRKRLDALATIATVSKDPVMYNEYYKEKNLYRTAHETSTREYYTDMIKKRIMYRKPLGKLLTCMSRVESELLRLLNLLLKTSVRISLVFIINKRRNHFQIAITF